MTPSLMASIEGAVEKTVDLDRLIHERVRLGITSALAVNESLGFNELRGLLKTTDGNLSVHARKLEEALYSVHQESSAHAAHRVPHHRPGPTRAPALSGPHGGADRRNARVIENLKGPPQTYG